MILSNWTLKNYFKPLADVQSQVQVNLFHRVLKKAEITFFPLVICTAIFRAELHKYREDLIQKLHRAQMVKFA